MTILTTYEALRHIALSEFADVVVNAQIITLPTGDPLKLRLVTDFSPVYVVAFIPSVLAPPRRAGR